MERGSPAGTYVAYFFICAFLLFLGIVAARSYAMIMSLVVMVFMGNTKPEQVTAHTDGESSGHGSPV